MHTLFSGQNVFIKSQRRISTRCLIKLDEMNFVYKNSTNLSLIQPVNLAFDFVKDTSLMNNKKERQDIEVT